MCCLFCFLTLQCEANAHLATPPAHGEYKHSRPSIALQNDYDTFGSSAAEMALSAARRDAESRPSIIPGGVLEELVVPVANSIGEGGERMWRGVAPESMKAWMMRRMVVWASEGVEGASPLALHRLVAGV